MDQPPPTPQPRVPAAPATHTVPIIEEQLLVEKELHDAGSVVVHVIPQTTRESVDIPVTLDEADIQRVPMNRIVKEAEPTRQEGDVTIVSVYEEVLVVEKRLLLKEEIRITRRRTTVTEHREVDLRREDVRFLRGSPKN